MSSVLISALAFILALPPPQAGAFPTKVGVVTRAYHYYGNSSPSNGSNSAVIAIVVVGVIIITFFIFCIIIRHRNRRMEMRGSTTTRHARNGTTRRTTVNYTNIAERTANALVETRGAGARSNNTTTRQTGVSRRPTQNSTRSLPVYNEQVPDGDVVLLERVRRRSMSENDEGGNSGDETENTPLTGAAPPYTASDPTPVTPRVTISSRGSTSSVESIQDRSENPGSDATTAASSVDVTEPEHARAPVVGMPGATVDTATTSYGGIPTYEEAIAAATNHIADVPEAAAPLRVEQR